MCLQDNTHLSNIIRCHCYAEYIHKLGQCNLLVSVNRICIAVICKIYRINNAVHREAFRFKGYRVNSFHSTSRDSVDLLGTFFCKVNGTYFIRRNIDNLFVICDVDTDRSVRFIFAVLRHDLNVEESAFQIYFSLLTDTQSILRSSDIAVIFRCKGHNFPDIQLRALRDFRVRAVCHRNSIIIA